MEITLAASACQQDSTSEHDAYRRNQCHGIDVRRILAYLGANWFPHFLSNPARFREIHALRNRGAFVTMRDDLVTSQIAAAFRAPECEMREFHYLYTRAMGTPTNEHYCPVGPLQPINQWEASRHR